MKRLDAILESELEAIVNTVASKLARHSAAVQYDELVGWANYGVAMARAEFLPDRIAVHDFQHRACHFMVQNGVRRAIDGMRTAGVIGRLRHGVQYGGPVLTMTIEDIQDVTDTGTSPAVAAERMEALQTAMGGMDDREVELYHSKYVEGMGYAEIAEKWGVSYTRVFQIHQRMIRRIRTMMAKQN